MDQMKHDHGLNLGGIALIVFGLEVLNGFLLGLQVGGVPPLMTFLLLMLFPASILFLLIGLIAKRGDRRLTLVRSVLLAVVGLCAWAFFGMGVRTFARASDWGNRVYVSSRIDLDDLHAWGVEILENWNANSEYLMDQEFDHGSATATFSDAVPEEVRNLVKPWNSLYVYDRGDAQKSIVIVYGGGHHHWGVVISSDPDMRGRTMGHDFYKWRDGIWGFQGE